MDIAEHALYDKDANEVYIYILNFIYPYINKFIICTQIFAIYNSNLNKLEKMAKITASA